MFILPFWWIEWKSHVIPRQAIDFISSAILLNLPHYKMNPSEYAKLQKQVNELLQKRFVWESLSSYTVL